MLKKIILILLVAPCSFAKLERVQEQGATRLLFDYKEVCSFFGVKNPLLANKSNAKTIDCMGREFLIEKFCLDKFKSDESYTKARFDIVEPRVVCHFAQTSVLSLECKNEYQHYCAKPKKGCEKLKRDFAYGLKLVRFHLLEKFPPILNCYYSSNKSDLTIDLSL